MARISHVAPAQKRTHQFRSLGVHASAIDLALSGIARYRLGGIPVHEHFHRTAAFPKTASWDRWPARYCAFVSTTPPSRM